MQQPIDTFQQAYAAIWDRSNWDRGYISNPFAGDEAARQGLVRTQSLLDRLGNPEHAYPIVHVAGSKGKGSTCSFVDSVMRAAGARSGRFLSPHLHSILERFVVDDIQISEAEFTGVVAMVMSATHGVETTEPAIGEITAWELSTAIALLWFAERDCDVVALEVGLGGTLDATNVVDPVVSAITRLDYEHTAILGDTMASIAGNKAGIIKPGRPVVTVDQTREAMDVIESVASNAGSMLLVAKRDWTAVGSSDSFDVHGPGWEHLGLKSSLRGAHQVENAGLAIAAIHLLVEAHPFAFNVDDAAIRRGLASTFVPSRFEIARHHSGATLVIDGAHSPESISALVQALHDDYGATPVVVIVAMLSGREPGTVLAPFAGNASAWLVTSSGSPRAIAAEELRAALPKSGADSSIVASVAEAIELAVQMPIIGEDGGIVVVTGSLATAAEARTALGLA